VDAPPALRHSQRMAPRIDFSDFPDAPLAHGPGMHGSELDAAFDDIKQYLPPTLRAEFKSQLGTTFERNAGEGVFVASGEASAGDSADGKGDTKVPMRLLYEVAMMVTGRWGITALPSVHKRNDGANLPRVEGRSDGANATGKVFQEKSSVSVFRQQDPFRPGQYMPFWERMKQLRELLLDRRAIAKKAYGKRKTEGKWVLVIDDMLHAVDYVLQQEGRAASKRTIFDGDDNKKKPFGMNVPVLKSEGNSKLPFIAYSELPMSTCPGAGDCGVYSKNEESGTISSTGGTGYCYSFKAWRYPDAFKRQFLNTLANTADREFTILRNNDGKDTDSKAMYWPRIRAAMRENGPRPWMQYVADQVLREAANIVKNDIRLGRRANVENGGRVVFFRLFVDGDIGPPDSVRSWMDAIKHMGSRSAIDAIAKKQRLKETGSMGTIQVYGYSKCWGEFVALDGTGYSWPENYTLNMSNASEYARVPEIVNAIKRLPITRGYFDAIDFAQHLQSLKNLKPDDIVMPAVPPMPGVSEKQLRGIVAIEEIAGEGMTAVEEARRILSDYFGIEMSTDGREVVELLVDRAVKRPESLVPPEAIPGEIAEAYHNRKEAYRKREEEYQRQYETGLRKEAIDLALRSMLKDKIISAHVKQELARDEGYVTSAALKKEFNIRVEKELAKREKQLKNNPKKYRGRKPYEPKPPKYESMVARQKKLVALLVHAIFKASHSALVTRAGGKGLPAGGSCPLVCGNCSDIAVKADDPVYATQESFRDFQAITGAVHRCASRRPTKDWTPEPGKRLPDGVAKDAEGVAKSYQKVNGKVRLGFYGADIHIGLH